MNGNGNPKLIRLLLVGLVLLTLLVISLGILLGVAYKDIRNSLAIDRDADIVAAIRSLKVVNGQDGKDGLTIVGADGRDGRNGTNSTSTVTVVQEPIQGERGERGETGAPARQVEFDGAGNWRYVGDEEWKPLFQPPPEEE